MSVAVLGSANLDIVIGAPRRPDAGETLTGSDLHEVVGGKGINQAMAAASLVRTAFVGLVGDDEAGPVLRAALADAGIEVSHLGVLARGRSGRAFITLTPDGENSIIVLPFANGEVTPSQVQEALDELQPAVVLSQLEIPINAVVAAAEWSERAGARFVLNPSPIAPVPQALIAQADPVIVNLGEARAILGRQDGSGTALAAELARQARSAVVTAGADGAFIASGAGPVCAVRAPRVTPVDTTGAGDMFAGVVAAEVSSGAALQDAVQSAVRAAAHVVQLPRAAR